MYRALRHVWLDLFILHILWYYNLKFVNLFKFNIFKIFSFLFIIDYRNIFNFCFLSFYLPNWPINSNNLSVNSLAITMYTYHLWTMTGLFLIANIHSFLFVSSLIPLDRTIKNHVWDGGAGGNHVICKFL